VVPQNISRRALSAGFAREQDDASGTEHRNEEGAATVPCCRTMRYGAATDFLASNSVHGNLSCACHGALNTIRQLLQYGRPPFAAGSACYSNIMFGSHGNLKFSNDQIESATRGVQSVAELTDIGSRNTAVAALPYVNQFTSAEFFLAGAFDSTIDFMRSHLNESPLTAAGCARCADGGSSGPDCPGAGGDRHAAARSVPGRPAWRVFG
jgi:hypothetical protein